jgi:hypothetical protein
MREIFDRVIVLNLVARTAPWLNPVRFFDSIVAFCFRTNVKRVRTLCFKGSTREKWPS